MYLISERRLPGSSATTVSSAPIAQGGAARARAATSNGIALASGWPTYTAWMPCLGVDRGLEREDAQHQVGGAADLADPPPRQAQIDGLTKCTVLTPAAFSLRSTPRLKSGASTPMKASGGSPSSRSTSRLRIAEDLAKVAEHLDIAAHRELLVRPPGVEALLGHARTADAVATSAGQRARRLASSAPPSRSPEASPATIAKRGDSVVIACAARQRAMPRLRGGEEAGHQRDVLRPLPARSTRARRCAGVRSSSASPSRYSNRCICLTAAIRAGVEAAPAQALDVEAAHASGLPSTIMYGGTSCETWLWNPLMRARRCGRTGARRLMPPRIAQSPSCTWPARPA